MCQFSPGGERLVLLRSVCNSLQLAELAPDVRQGAGSYPATLREEAP